MTGSTGVEPGSSPSSEAHQALLDQLRLALDDDFDELSMAPLGAGISQEAWDDLPEDERQAIQLQQLRAIDPRLLPNTVLNPRGLFSRDELFAEELQADF